MRWSDIPRDPPRTTLRQFAGIWLIAFAALAAWKYQTGHNGQAALFNVLAVTVGPLGLLRPQTLRWLFVGWLILVFPIGWLVARVTLAFLFYGVLTPIAVIGRLSGRDPLGLRARPEADTYWTAKPAPGDLTRYYRQF